MSYTSGKRVITQKPCKAAADFNVFSANNDSLVARTGTFLVLASATLLVPNNNLTPVVFAGTVYDPAGWWSNAQATRFTVPTGITFAQFGFSYAWQNTETQPEILVYKNGGNFVGMPDVMINIGNAGSASGAVVQVTGGDFFEMKAIHQSGTNQNVTVYFEARGWK